MYKVTTQENQTIMDVAIQEYGNQLAVFEIVADNPTMAFDGMQVDKPLPEGQKLNIRSTDDKVKRNIRQDLSRRKVTSHVLMDAPDGGQQSQYLVNELGVPITDENDNFIIVNL